MVGGARSGYGRQERGDGLLESDLGYAAPYTLGGGSLIGSACATEL